MNELIIGILIIAWSGMMYAIGVENGEAKYINRNNKDREL